MVEDPWAGLTNGGLMDVFKNLREELESLEEKFLAAYAAKSGKTKGRKYQEEPHPYRTHFQRDRERIIHSTAFRRLEYKTQVFVNHEGDHYRTRLTHTIEVAQISRSIARALRLNEDLAEAIALVHDLGHTPFGHSGEQALDEIMMNYGGFEHNRQSLRVVDVMEEKYPKFPGLNLTFEVREGIMKHETIYDQPIPAEFNPQEVATLECQIVNLADEIAYNCHDIDDGLASGILKEEDLQQVELWKHLSGEVRAEYSDLSFFQMRNEVVRKMIDTQVSDLINETTRRITKYRINTLEDVRNFEEGILSFGQEMKKKNSQLKMFLFDNMYRHYRMIRMADKAKRIIKQLFDIYMNDVDQLPPTTRNRVKEGNRMQAICDYVAGMTDRYALQEYKKLFDPMERV